MVALAQQMVKEPKTARERLAGQCVLLLDLQQKTIHIKKSGVMIVDNG